MDLLLKAASAADHNSIYHLQQMEKLTPVGPFNIALLKDSALVISRKRNRHGDSVAACRGSIDLQLLLQQQQQQQKHFLYLSDVSNFCRCSLMCAAALCAGPRGEGNGGCASSSTVQSETSMRKRSRRTCHRCGNVRDGSLLCVRGGCPHRHCVGCIQKLTAEHGAEAFAGGCPRCKLLCCCARKSAACARISHCYRKCPASKA